MSNSCFLYPLKQLFSQSNVLGIIYFILKFCLVLVITTRSLIYLKLILVIVFVWARDHIFTQSYFVLPAHLLKSSPILNCSCSFVQNSLALYVCVYLLILLCSTDLFVYIEVNITLS